MFAKNDYETVSIDETTTNVQLRNMTHRTGNDCRGIIGIIDFLCVCRRSLVTTGTCYGSKEMTNGLFIDPQKKTYN